MIKRKLSDLASGEFDLLIIGGGILGAGVARDATLRGLRVALLEQNDFASGTSSRSTKLIHGGFRYLEQAEFRLVREACHERATLQRIAPHLVKRQSFLLPVYEIDRRPLWMIRIGMTIYDLLAGREQIRKHRTLTVAETSREEPLLPVEGLRGAILFDDCQMDDSRLCLETILDAAHQGAVVANYCEVVGAERIHDSIVRMVARDRISGSQCNIRTKAVVNASGPWIENVVGITGWNPTSVALSPTKGVHLILPSITRHHGIFFQSRFDDRMLFLIPWYNGSLLGTTDTNYSGDPRRASADREDVDYLLGRLHDVLPDCGIDHAGIITTFAGIRPLLRADRQSPSNRSREYRLVQHGDNLLSVAGGKYTTFRAIADHVVRRVFRLLGRKAPRCKTASSPMVDRRPKCEGIPLVASTDTYATDIRHACHNEMAVTLIDVMRRRTRVALSPQGGPETANRISQLMAKELGWDSPTRARMVDDYLREWERAMAWRKE